MTDLDALRREVLGSESCADQTDAQVTVTRRVATLADHHVASRRCLGRERSKVFFDLGAQRQVMREGQFPRREQDGKILDHQGLARIDVPPGSPPFLPARHLDRQMRDGLVEKHVRYDPANARAVDHEFRLAPERRRVAQADQVVADIDVGNAPEFVREDDRAFTRPKRHPVAVEDGQLLILHDDRRGIVVRLPKVCADEVSDKSGHSWNGRVSARLVDDAAIRQVDEVQNFGQIASSCDVAFSMDARSK